jgi:hypothetical protein
MTNRKVSKRDDRTSNKIDVVEETKAEKYLEPHMGKFFGGG